MIIVEFQEKLVWYLIVVSVNERAYKGTLTIVGKAYAIFNKLKTAIED